MIKFKSCKWKNFLSTGNDAIEIKLDKSPTTLIVGQNGAGKSTLLDAMSFGLFGKPHRDIGKYQLINSINGKQCIVEVEFEIGTSEFKIVRGIKPNKFEIWQNLEFKISNLKSTSFSTIMVSGLRSNSFLSFSISCFCLSI